MKKKPTSLIKSSLMSFKSRLLAVYQSEETIYVWWEDVFLAGTLEESRVLQWLRSQEPCIGVPRIWTFRHERKDKWNRK